MILLNESKIKYEKLNSLLESILCDITLSSQVNIIVDLKEVIRKIFRNGIPEGSSHKKLIEEISADIINIISHYRNYFYKNGKYTSFYFIYSKTECSEILKNYNGYKSDYYMKYFKSDENKELIGIIERVIKICEKVINYTPNSYFIDSSNLDELVYIRYIIEKSNTNELNVLLTNDPIMYQLLNKHTVALSLKGIRSELITEKDAVSILVKDEDEHCSCRMIPLILAMAGHKKYSIKNVSGIALVRATNIVNSLIKDGLVLDTDSVELPIQISKLDVNDKLHKIIIKNIDLITSNYNLIRNDKLYFSNINLIPASFIVKPATVSRQVFLELNSKLFTMYPLQLDMMLKGEKL